ncbi:MAG: PKD domain-containing protein, partial [Candidatus Thermoplasmatota archaeon]|nr:PKD domain-containing protein [Candidatus Thermoplasmatota archaeon]
MRFDFNWWDSPFDPLDPEGSIDPHVTRSKQMQDPPVGTNQQMEEYMDGLGYWMDTDDDGRPNIPGDINGGRIWVLIWRTDNQPDDYDNRTMDLLIYCGYNEKLSWIVLPYRHPQQLPVADTGEEKGFPENKEDFLLPFNDPRHEEPVFTEAFSQLKEGDIIVFNGSRSYDPQDDIGSDGIGYGDPLWVAPDIGEDNKNIDDGFPEGEVDYGETDTLFYKWEAETSIDNKNYNIPLSTGWQDSPMLEWKVRLPAMDGSLPADQQFQVVNVTLTVRDRDNYQGTHTIQILAFKSQNRPVVSITAIPQVPKEFGRDNEAYVLPQQEIQLQGYAYDPDPNSELSYYWSFEGEWNTFYREGATILTEYFEEAGDWNITLTVYDGPLDNINTLNGTSTLMLHVIDNTEPVPVIRAGLNPNMREEGSYYLDSINASKNRIVYFNGSFSYDPDVWVPEDLIRQIEEHWQGLPGFDEDLDGVPDMELKYQWDWGDGSRTESFSSNSQAEHKWSDRGASSKYKEFWPVVLKVWDGNTISDSEEYRVYINLPPIADAGSNQPLPGQDEIEVGMTVFFNGKGSYDANDDPNYDGKRPGGEYNDRLVYLWDFGDGSPTEFGIAPNHTYGSATTYTVVLTVKDGKYSDEDDMKVKIVPANKDPVGVVEINAESWIDINSRQVFTNVPLTFDAAQSFDPDGEFYNDGLV